MKLKLIISALLLCAVIKAQTKSELKEFINKNNIAIRSVQKNMVALGVKSYEQSFLELVKKQYTAVKLYSLNPSTSVALAVSIRKESLSFLQEYTKGSKDYFEFTAEEKKYQQTTDVASDYKSTLTESELKVLNAININDFQALNHFTLTIQ